MTTLVKPWYLYMVKNGRGQFYTGISTDVERRVSEHQQGIGAKALRGKGPIELLWHAEMTDRSHASRAEYWVKQLNKSQKLALIQGDLALPDFVEEKA